MPKKWPLSGYSVTTYQLIVDRGLMKRWGYIAYDVDSRDYVRLTVPYGANAAAIIIYRDLP